MVLLQGTLGDTDVAYRGPANRFGKPNGGTGFSPGGVGHPFCLNQGDEKAQSPERY